MSLNEIGLAVFVVAIVVALVVAYVRGVRQERHARELRDVIDAETRRAVRRRPGNGEHVFPSLAVSDPKPPDRKKVP